MSFDINTLQTMFGKDVQTSYNGLSVGDKVKFVIPHTRYTPSVVRGFGLDGLYCYFDVQTSDNETYTFVAFCCISGVYVFDSYYQLVKLLV